MTEDFEDPGSAIAVDWDALLGSLLIIAPSAVEKDIQTVNGMRDAVRASIDVVDGKQAGEHFGDALVFPKVLQGQLRSMTGKRVIGRLTKGVAKPGQNAPWKLDDATHQDKALGRRFLAGQLTSAAAPARDEPPF